MDVLMPCARTLVLLTRGVFLRKLISTTNGKQFHLYLRASWIRQVSLRIHDEGVELMPRRIPPKPDLLTTDVDYKGVIYGTQLAIHFMRKNKTPGGKIVATASVAAIEPHETYPEYDGAKAAVVNFVRATSRILKSVS
jgi:hypothetical protein